MKPIDENMRKLENGGDQHIFFPVMVPTLPVNKVSVYESHLIFESDYLPDHRLCPD